MDMAYVWIAIGWMAFIAVVIVVVTVAVVVVAGRFRPGPHRAEIGKSPAGHPQPFDDGER
jgi:heme/copper-type cytochrome/quinol oxidase subunit 2